MCLKMMGATRILASGAALFFAGLLASCGDPRVIETTFDENYKAANAGKVRVEIRDAYELAQIAYALAEARRSDANRTWNKGAYYDAMTAHFAPHKNHPAIDAVDYEKWPEYWSYRQNSLAYSYKDGALVHTGDYETLWNSGEDKFAKAKSDLETFARDADFDAFYADHADYYAYLENEFSELVDPAAMQRWLHENFTARYDSYLIAISPLVGGAHNFAIVRDSHYAEAIITISASNIYDKDRDTEGNISAEARLKFSRVIFTELDHNYVNPASDRFKSEIKNAIGDVNQWNSSGDYRSAEATFNEYVTWAIFPLFVRSEYGDFYVEAAIADVNRVMTRRGFPKFPEFNEWMVSNTSFSTGAKPVEASYEDVIAWFAAQ